MRVPSTPLHLVMVEGPVDRLAARRLRVDGDAATIGRGPGSEICLPDGAVSRRHARLVWRDDAWHLIDEGGVNGTWLNGVRLEPEQPAQISRGDRIRLGPWTVQVNGEDPDTQTLVLDDDDVDARPVAPAPNQRLDLLSECMQALGGVDADVDLARIAVTSALRGTGFQRGAVLRRLGREDRVEVVISLEATHSNGSGVTAASFHPSRRLIETAATGETAVMTGPRDESGDAGRSVADLEIHSAVCAPIRLDGGVYGYLYLDARGSETAVQRTASMYCTAIAQAYGLALACAQRSALERRQSALRAELERARELQTMLAPARTADASGYVYAHRMEPGLFVSGDLFDVLRLEDGRMGMCFGDAAGHGFGAAMLTGLVQAYLHAEFQRAADPAAAVCAANRFLADRETGGRFVSLWAGVFSDAGRIEYVDAGHGYWRVLDSAGGVRDAGGSHAAPIGISRSLAYGSQALTLAPGEMLLLFSDGVLDQRGASGERFGLDRLLAAARDGAGDVGRTVDAIFRALESFCGSPALDDDASVTALMRRGSADVLRA